MDRQGPAEGSSSPSAKLRVVAAGRSGTIGERFKITLSDGSSFLLPADALLQQGVPVGELQPEGELAAEDVRRLEELAAGYALRSRALRFLDAGAQTAAGLRRKLLARGAAPSAVEAVLASLAREGLLDDRAFARGWVQSRLERHPEGEGPLVGGLLRRGVGRELAREVVGELLDPQAERQSAERLLEKLERRSGMSRERLEASLRRRGFSRGLIRELLEDR
jgi:regulatory protein